MRSAAVLAVPCVVTDDGDRDALPTVVIEAMAHGLPVLATDVNGLPEMVEDAVSGVVVPQRSPEAFATALGTLLADPAGRDALATAARSRAEALFDLRRNVGALADLYAGAGAAR
jgi:glycosyltransferase involved in cell wall biosynthesis